MSDIHHARIQHIKAMLQDQPADSFLLFALAKEYDYIGKADAAIATFRKLLDVDEEYIGAYYHLAELLYRSEMEDDALDVADNGINLAQKQNAQKDLAELLQLKESF